MASDIPARAIAADGLNWAKGQVISARAENLSPSMIPYISGEDANGNLMLSFALFADLPGFTSGGGVTLPITIADVTDLQTTLDDLQDQIDLLTVAGGVDANGNTWLGADSLGSVTSGLDNSALGHDALTSLVDGAQNTAVGAYALKSAVSNSVSTAVGYAALYLATATTPNDAFGAGALYHLTTGTNNVAVGYASMYDLITGARNVGVGNGTLTNVLLSDNTAIGYTALVASVNASGNTAVGSYSLAGNTNGDYNVAVGYKALENETDTYENVAVGRQALAAASSGYGVDVTTGARNTALGALTSVSSATATYRTVIGFGATSTQDNTVILGRTTDDTGIGVTAPQGKLHVGGRLHLSEVSANPAAADLTSGSNAKDRIAMYMKADKLVFAYNDGAGAVNYLTFTLDGSTTTFTNSTTAP